MRKKIIVLAIIITMIPLLSFGQSARKPVSKISFDFMDADVRNVLRVLTEVSGKNIVISDDVKGKVTIKLENVSWDDALDLIVKTNDLAMLEEGNIVRIVTAKRLADLRERERKERLDFLKEKQEKERLGEEFVTETIFLNYTTAGEVEKVIRAQSSAQLQASAGKDQVPANRGLLSEYGTITTVAWSNALIIRDSKENVAQIKKMIRDHDFAPAQVQIEARIVQASSNFSKELGIQWGARYNGQISGEKVQLAGARDAGTTSTSTSYLSNTGTTLMRDNVVQSAYNVNLPATVGLGHGGTLGVFIGSVADSLQLDVQLSALEEDGKGKIISNPKVVTADNKPAVIKQGQRVPYQTVSQSGTQTEFIDAALSLEVTPQVTKDNNIKLRIKATKNRPLFTTNPPTLDIKEATTEVIIRDGETAVIGGIYEKEDDSAEYGIPALRRIPLLGWLFKKETKTDTKSELLIFITPTIIKNLYKEEG
jgi:type IV pilus assembly protein PilQ